MIKIKLTEEQKQIANNLGMTEEEYLEELESFEKIKENNKKLNEEVNAINNI